MLSGFSENAVLSAARRAKNNDLVLLLNCDVLMAARGDTKFPTVPVQRLPEVAGGAWFHLMRADRTGPRTCC